MSKIEEAPNSLTDKMVRIERNGIADFIKDKAEEYNHPLVKQELKHMANKIRQKQHHDEGYRKDQ